MDPAQPSVRTRTALITGATRGIGYELSKLFAKDGYHLVLVARDGQRLNQVAKEMETAYGIKIRTILKDLSGRTAAEAVFDELQKDSTRIDVLVNNAGYALYGPFRETDLGSELGMMQINMESPTQLTKLCLDQMIKRGEGKILNVASTAAFQPGPLMAVYYATKAYILSFSEALANELQGTGVTVTALCPGPTKTGFQERAGIEGLKMYGGWRVLDAETVARIGYRGMMEGRTVVVPGLFNKLLAFTVRLGPRNLVTRIARRLQEGRKRV